MALMSLVISLLLWANVFNARSGKNRTQAFSVKVRPISLDDTKYVVTDIPEDISVTIAGSTAQIRNALAAEPNGYIDLGSVRPGTSSYPVNIQPSSIREMLVNPTVTARLKVEPLAIKSVPVTVTRMGKLAAKDLKIESIDTFPRAIFIAGSEDAIQKTTSVAVSADLNDAIASPEGEELEARAIDASGRVVPRVLITPNNKDVHYREEDLAVPFKIRVRIRLAQPLPL